MYVSRFENREPAETARQRKLLNGNQALLVYQIGCGYHTLAVKIRALCRTSVSLRPACSNGPKV